MTIKQLISNLHSDVTIAIFEDRGTDGSIVYEGLQEYLINNSQFDRVKVWHWRPFSADKICIYYKAR